MKLTRTATSAKPSGRAKAAGDTARASNSRSSGGGGGD